MFAASPSSTDKEAESLIAEVAGWSGMSRPVPEVVVDNRDENEIVAAT